MADQSVTSLATKATPLPLEVRADTGFTHKWTIDYTDINNSAWTGQGDTVTVTLGNTPTEFLIGKAAAYIETAFATTGTLTLQVGTDGDPDNFIDAQSCKTQTTLIGSQGGEPVTEAGSVGTAADVLTATFTTQASTGAPADITAGKVHILLQIIDLAKI